jgi:hypothetical protein
MLRDVNLRSASDTSRACELERGRSDLSQLFFSEFAESYARQGKVLVWQWMPSELTKASNFVSDFVRRARVKQLTVQRRARIKVFEYQSHQGVGASGPLHLTE